MNTTFNRIYARPWLLALTGLVLLVVVGVLSVQPIITSKFEGMLDEKLKEFGLVGKWDSSFWNPLSGQHFSGLKITSEKGSKNAPVAEIDSVKLRPSFRRYFGSDKGSIACEINSSSLVLWDEEGKVRMDDVAFKCGIEEGQISIKSLTFRKDGLSADLKGEILLPDSKDEAEPYDSNLTAFRTVFDILDIEGDKGALDVSGELDVDCSRSPVTWNAELEARGTNFEWNGVRWTNAEAGGKVSSEKTEITYDLETARGFAGGDVKKSGGEGAALVINGKLSDSSGEITGFQAELLDGILNVKTIEGSADLWELSKDVVEPKLVRPKGFIFTDFPQIEVKNLKRRTVDGKVEMTIESIVINCSEPLRFEIDGRTVEATDYSASGKFDGVNWIVKEAKADLLGGSMTLSGSYGGGALRDSRLGAESLRIEEVRRLFGAGEGKSSGNISGYLNGSFDFAEKDWEGKGFLRMTDAPVIQVPLLDQIYEIFMSLIPGVKRAEAAEFEADFTKTSDTVKVSRFEALGGKSLVVIADGNIDIQKGWVQGKASGKLQGLPGALTSPVTRLIKMEVSGHYDEIHVKALNPAELASGAVEDTIDTLREAGKETGEAIKDGLKAPLERLGGGGD